VGESITEGILSRWMKPPGSAVSKGEPLFEIETDKASNVVNAPAAGVLLIDVTEGETVPIGATVGRIDTEGKPAASAKATAGGPPGPSAAPPPASASPRVEGATATPSPAVRRIAAEEGVALSSVKGTGPGGRITKGDVIGHLEGVGADTAAAATDQTATAASPGLPQQNLAPARTLSRQRMSGIRQRIAARLVEAQQTAAILTTFNEADMSAVMGLRAKYKEPFQKKHGVGLGFMSFFVKASIEALRAFPSVNSRIEGNEIISPNYHDIGIAASTERGLMVPVVRDADRLSFAEIEQRIADYAKKARENTIAVSDLQGGTFTITNGGVFGSLLSTPILNPPQSGILGMHKIQERPVVMEGQIVARPMMYLALSYDHRIVDGREAVSFLVRVKECIEHPERILIEI
jgi:2-oxoglutarate dehydrogenase E2 component (dihydrolipoamide succinyltransferase)